MARSPLQINNVGLMEVLKTVAGAVERGEGFFHGDWKREFLPEWNLPPELEHEPRQQEVKKPLEASLYLFTRCFMDRMSLSSSLSKYAQAAWANEGLQWIFDPVQVVDRTVDEVSGVLVNHFRYNLDIIPGMNAGEGYSKNCKRLLEEYGGDPRTIIAGRSVDDALTDLREFHGFGPGISRLYLTETHHRGIAVVNNPEELENKIDRHKGRILFNTEVLTTTERRANMSSVVSVAQPAYAAAFQANGVDVATIDAALWIIGSEGCRARNYSICRAYCPLSRGHCKSNTLLEHDSGQYILRDDNGPIDTRQKNQPAKGQSNHPLLFAPKSTKK